MESPEKRQPGPGRWVAVALVLLAAVVSAAWYYRFREAAPPIDPVSPPAVSVAPELREPAPERPPPPVETAETDPYAGVSVPSLDESDPLIRELVGTLSRHPSLASWLATEGLIRRAVVATVNVSEGKTPVRHLPFLKPQRGFSVERIGAELRIAPETYRRYDRVADVFASIDGDGVIQLYRRLEPLFDQAYADLGYPDEDFDAALRESITRLLEVPVPEEPVLVVEDVLTYAYLNPELEELDDAQRQLLRMGPRNVRLVQAKLREIAAALEATP